MVSKTKAQKEEGTIYISGADDYYDAPEITAEILNNHSRNYYGRSMSERLQKMIFTGTPDYTVFNGNAEVEDEVGEDIAQMAIHIDIPTRMKQAWFDTFWFGLAIFNPVSSWIGNQFTYTELRRLPPKSFAYAPSDMTEIYSNILQGVVLNSKREIDYYQTVDEYAEPVKLNADNLFVVKDPSHPELAGQPTILPLVPIITMLDYTWHTQMQKLHRVGAPIMFMKITNPGGDDVDYARKILQNWGKNTAFVLRENMEVINLNLQDNSSALETEERLAKLVVDYFSPTSMVSKTGSLISGSSAGEVELFRSYIIGIHDWLERGFEPLLQNYLDQNGYEDYTVKIDIPAPDTDRSDVELKQAEAGWRTRALTINEIREKLGMPELSEDALEELKAGYDSIPPAEFKTGDPLGDKMEDDILKAEDELDRSLFDIIRKRQEE